MQQRAVVYSNTIHSMFDLIKNMKLYKIGFEDPKREVFFKNKKLML